MPETSESLRCRGMRDLLPSDMARFRHIEEAFLRVCRSWGYEEVRTPTIEYLHLFTAAGTLSPQMLHRVYSFLDWDGWSGERVVLRPDATIPAARLYTEQLEAGRVSRLCYVQNIFRFASGDEPREDWQCGVELIGPSGLAGDIELVLLGVAILEAAGAGDVEVTVSHAGLVRAVLVRTGLPDEEQSTLYDRLLDGDVSVIGEIESRLPDLDVPLHLLFDGPGAGSTYLATIRETLEAALPEIGRPLAELTALVTGLEALGRTVAIQAALARSFEYYSGPVFRFRVSGLDVGGGGRYDDLLGLVGGAPAPATGFALEPRAIAALISDEGQEEERMVLIRPAESSSAGIAAAFRVAAELRQRGVACRLAGATERTAEREIALGTDARLKVRVEGTERQVDGILQAASLLGGRA